MTTQPLSLQAEIHHPHHHRMYKISVLALVALTARCAFNYFPNVHPVSFFPFAPDVLITRSFYAYYIGVFVSYLCIWAALGYSFKDLKFQFTVLFFAELAALFDFMLRYGEDIIWPGFDMNKVKIVAFGVSFPVNFLLKHYGGSHIKQ